MIQGNQGGQLVAYDKVQDVGSFIKQLGHSIAHSKMFGCENEQQGEVMAMECLARRSPPMSLAETYHIIHGRLSMKAKAKLAAFQQRGGTYKIVERSPDQAAIELSKDGSVQEFSLSWDQASQEPFVYQGKESEVVEALASGKAGDLKLKPKYATPISRKQMLWARMIGDAVDAMDSGAAVGIHTPEEVSDFVEVATSIAPQVEDAEVVVQTTEQSVETATTNANDGYCTSDQAELITSLYVDLKIPYETQQDLLKKYGGQSLRNLKREDAQVIIDKLNAMAEKSRNATEETTAVANTAPCTQEQIDKCTELLKSLAQQGKPEIAGQLKQKLTDSGLEKVRDLNYVEAEMLIGVLQQANLAAFIEMDLQGHAKN